ncbi:hydroxymethylglutaryl-CoA synthase family protein [Xylocopilactobacillus apis]|uniref:Hydroxymethylglutaryl-CoA synthase n=1 Tax=Xylocopilactobacillus apis TaxID=2932183 RepID=A0AAU9CZS7_9LACO|nr:hydroxymethylglutaryl-CoA synthase [Xylocopilactobacillus apis]BDR56788.1 hydroxymethylglutaryl-CoA synthase [Xylocopilactobacillus apis]
MIGINKIACYIPQNYLKMTSLASARGVDPKKFLIGIGQEKMAVVGGNEDSISMGLNSARRLLDSLTSEEKESIKLVIFATESSVDESKAGSLFFQQYLGLSSDARYFEIKEACYGATAGLDLAIDRVTLHPDEKVLIVASDIARYGLNSGGEVTQGAGSVAMLVENSLETAFETVYRPSYYAQNVPDFYRPMGCEEAIVDGPLSNQTYLQFFKHVFEDFFKSKPIMPEDLKMINFHMPYTKIGLKALNEIKDQINIDKFEEWVNLFNQGKSLNAEVGNIYTGSLYLNLLSNVLAGNLNKEDLIGMYSYGSGSQSEFYVLKAHAIPDLSSLSDLLINRQEVEIKTYEKMYQERSDELNQQFNSEGIRLGDFYLKEVVNGNRIYDQK